MNHCLKEEQVILFLTLNLDTPLLHFLLLLGSITKLTKKANLISASAFPSISLSLNSLFFFVNFPK